MSKLDLSVFEHNTKCISLGTLSQEMIAFISSKKPDIGSRLSSDQQILFWKDRIKHTEEHRNDFMSDALFDMCMEDIPEIIQAPDYISIHPTGKSISFIKDYSQHISVAIKISIDGRMCYRTMYPIMDAQLDNYLDNDRAWRYAPEYL